MVSKSARIGVMPTPPATSSTSRRVRRSAVMAPYGPSAITLVPTGTRCSRSEPSPSDLTVSRNRFPTGGGGGGKGGAGGPQGGGGEPPPEKRPAPGGRPPQ